MEIKYLDIKFFLKSLAFSFLALLIILIFLTSLLILFKNVDENFFLLIIACLNLNILFFARKYLDFSLLIIEL